MKFHAGLLLAAASVTLWAGCQKDATPTPSETKEYLNLVVLTPHGEPIQDAFAEAFSRWYEEKYKKIITVQWISRGTPLCEAYIEERYGINRSPSGATPTGIGVDIFFGGGLPAHRRIIEQGYSEPIAIPKEVLDGIPKELNGQVLYDPQGNWYGTALTGFGILFNRRACTERGIPVPTTWDDLTRPEMFGWVCLADPTRSGSSTTCLDMIVQRYGWTDGWAKIVRLVANSRALASDSREIPTLVRTGECLAGLVTEFTASAAIVGASGDRLAYINPPGATAFTPDPITVLRGAEHLEDAKRFEEFCLTRSGQALLALPAGSEDGPKDETLHRHPIRPDVYETYKDRLVVHDNPFTSKVDFQFDPEMEAAHVLILPAMVMAMCGDNHIPLQKRGRRRSRASCRRRSLPCWPRRWRRRSKSRRSWRHSHVKTTADQWARTWSREFPRAAGKRARPAGVPPESPSSDSTSAPASGAATE